MDAPAEAPAHSRLDGFELEARKLAGVVAVGFSGTEGDLTVHLTLSDATAAMAARSDLPRLLALYFDGPVSCSLDLAGGGTIAELFRVAPEPSAELGLSPAREGEPIQQFSRSKLAGSRPGMLAPETRPSAGRVRPDSPATAVPIDESSATSRQRVELVSVNLAGEGAYVDVRLSFGEQEATGRGSGALPMAAADATLASLRLLGWKTPFVVRSAIRLAVGVDGAVIVHLEGPGGDRIAISRARTPQEAAVKATLHALNRYLADPRHRSD